MTTIHSETALLPAESYHQDYYTRTARQPYCRAVVAPKMAKARRSALAQLK